MSTDRLDSLNQKVANATFWTAPRKTWARRWFWQIHFWTGLIAGLLWTVVGLTGSLLVFIPELRRVEVSGWTKVAPMSRTLPIQETVDRLLAERPGDKMYSIYWDFKPNWALNLRTVAPNGDRIHNFVDQYRGTVLASVNYNKSRLQWFYDLHETLLSGEKGRRVNAWFAVALVLASSLGLLLWWRGVKQWKLGLEYRLKARWKRQNWDIHNLGGLVFYIPLLLLSITGAYYGYQLAFASFFSAVTRGPAVVAPPKISPAKVPWRSLDEMAENALAALPRSTLSMINFPQKPGDALSFRLKLSSDPHRIGLNWVYVDPVSSRVLRVDKLADQPPGVKLMRWMTPIHYGTFGGYTTRVLWIFAGLMPGTLFVTSLLMWWNRSLSKKWRRRAVRPPQAVSTGAEAA
jgi:uncharacterized iron-regulated membrane protein